MRKRKGTKTREPRMDGATAYLKTGKFAKSHRGGLGGNTEERQKSLTEEQQHKCDIFRFFCLESKVERTSVIFETATLFHCFRRLE